MSIDFHILGSLKALDHGRDVTPSGKRQRAFLALLLLHANETLTTDRLIEEFWGEHAPATAPKALQVHVSRLRKAFVGGHGRQGDCPIVTHPRGYELRLDAGRLDARRFEQLLTEGRGALTAGHAERAVAVLEEALSLWRGAPLAEFAYEPFAQAEIARLQEARPSASEELVEAQLSLGRHAEVIPHLEALIAEHPFRERARAQLMLGLYRSDRQADALQAYQSVRRMLVEELGIEPGRRLRDLHQAMLAQDPALAAPVLPTTKPRVLSGGRAERSNRGVPIGDPQVHRSLARGWTWNCGARGWAASSRSSATRVAA